MNDVIVFGGGGSAGRTVVEESRRRGLTVTAVVRDPARHADLAADGVTLAQGDVLDAERIAELARGHRSAVAAVYDGLSDAGTFYPAASRALLSGLSRAEVGRLVVVTLSSLLPGADGVPLLDSSDYPQEHRGFILAHRAGVEVLQAHSGDIDWLAISPTGDFDRQAGRSGKYRVSHGDSAARLSYADLAVAIVDEVATPRHHRVHIGIDAE